MGFLTDLAGIASDALGGIDTGADIRAMDMHNVMDANNSKLIREMDHQNEMRRSQAQQDMMNMHFMNTRSNTW